MRKKNCWEFKLCGRQPGGGKELEFGVCPVALATEFNKTNNGVNAGRYCWNVDSSFCEFQTYGTFAQKSDICSQCAFMERVKDEEGANFVK